jgi:hypothetical protein
MKGSATHRGGDAHRCNRNAVPRVPFPCRRREACVALVAAEQIEQQRQELRRSLDLELEQARYEARLAARRYEAVDPDQRLVAAELEARWNSALQKTRELEDKLQDFDLGINKARVPSKELLLSLAQDLPAIWNSPSTGTRLKQRIVRILIEEVVADVDESSREIVLLLHWAGGPAKL